MARTVTSALGLPVTRCVWFVASLWFVGQQSLAAQAVPVRGFLEEAETARPVAGAAVYLLDAERQAVRGTLSDGSGAFRLAAPRPGLYSLQVERIGFETTVFDPFDVPASGVQGLRAVIEVQPVEIRGLSVSTDRVCSLDRATGNLIQVWSEARKTLSAAMLPESDPGAGFRIEISEREYTRDLDVLVEALDTAGASVAHAFGFVPVETFGDRGWGQLEDEEVTELYGPSPNVLLSPWFGEHHCLSLEDRSTDSHVGLSFASLDGELEVGIEGVFWLRRDTWGLERIDFRFTGPRSLSTAPNQGGQVTLASSPSGSWYVSSWYVRRPVYRVDLWRLELGRGNVESLRRLIGYAERAGRVLD